jgi:hypothetical protein
MPDLGKPIEPGNANSGRYKKGDEKTSFPILDVVRP